MFEKNGTMYMQTKLKKRKVGRLPLKTGASADALEMKERDIVDNSAAAASSTPSKKVRTEMSKLTKAMTLLCSVDDVYIRNLIKKHKFGVREDLSAKVMFSGQPLVHRTKRRM